jgi:hypothetical protein
VSYESKREIPGADRQETAAPRAPDARGAAATAARRLGAGLAPRAGGFSALARTAGNRRAARLLQRQSATVTGRFLRVRVTGHASARWKSARTGKQAAERNQALSERRAEAVKELILRELSGKVPVPVDVDVCVLDADEGDAVTVGGHGEGSREALERTGGDRRSNEQRDRRVDIAAELATTEERSDRVRVRQSSRTRDWEFTITRFKDAGFYYMRAELELELRNRRSGQVVTGRARLEGGGNTKDLLPDKGGLGPKNKRLRTDRPVGFRDFDGCLLRMYEANVKLGLGWRGQFLVFGGVRKEPVLLESKWGVGLPRGHVLLGELELDTMPEDYMESEHDGPPYKARHGLGQGISVTFGTGSAAIDRADADRIRAFADSWARRFE